MSTRFPLPAHALLLQGLLLGMLGVGLERESLPLLAVLYAAAFLVLVHGVKRGGPALEDPRALLLWAIAFRITLFPALPDLSDDPFRYIWDGRLTTLGINPYAYVPADPALRPLQQGVLFDALNSPFFFSIYPPLSQLLFVPSGWIHGILGWPASFFALKGTVLALETTGVLLLLQGLRRSGRRLAPFALYAWNPLVLVAVAGNAHTEGAMVFGVGLLVAGLFARGPLMSWLGTAAAGMVKGVPFAWSFLLARFSFARWGSGATAGAAAAAAALSAVLVLPFWFPDLPRHVGSSAELYVRDFEFNAGLYYLLKESILRWGGSDPTPVLGPALRIVFLLWLAFVSLLVPCRRVEDAIRGFLLVVTGYLVTATTVHPWYLLWLLPFLPFTTLLRSAWTWVSFASFGTYFVYLEPGDTHRLQLALATLVWGGFAVLLVLEGAPALYQGLLRWAGRRKGRHLLPHLSRRSVLDLGAGEGYVAAELRKGGLSVSAADVTPMRRAPVPYVVYDGRALPFPSDCVDHVVISLVLHHAEDPRPVVREALRVARRSVVVTESTYGSPMGLRVLTLLDRAANRFRGGGSLRAMEERLHFRTVDEWTRLFQEEGGRVVALRWLNRTIHHYVLFELEPVGRPDGAVGKVAVPGAEPRGALSAERGPRRAP